MILYVIRPYSDNTKQRAVKTRTETRLTKHGSGTGCAAGRGHTTRPVRKQTTHALPPLSLERKRALLPELHVYLWSRCPQTPGMWWAFAQ